MIEEFKNWLIKKLGGYTQQEYNMAFGVEPTIVKREDINVEKLCTKIEIERGSCSIPSLEYLKESLLRQFSEVLEPYVEFYINTNSPDVIIYRANLRVVKKGN